MDTHYHKKIVLDIFYAALKAADPCRLTSLVAGRVRSVYQKSGADRLIVTGFGKASCSMAKALSEELPDIIEAGIIVTKYGHAADQDIKDRDAKSGITIFEAGHPVPDESGLQATEEIIKLLKGSDAQTLLVCLISGGGSALLISPYQTISLKDKQAVTGLLLRAGADINELNTVRKHISNVKGGRLAEIAFPATILSLIISDVIGDRLDVIASGPTSPDSTTYKDALSVIAKYGLRDQTPQSVLEVLQKGTDGLIPESPKEDSPVFKNVENIIIGNNRKALEAARAMAETLGFDAEVISSEITGEAGEVGKKLARRAIETRNNRELKRPCCLISGGETTVTVKGSGLGGRNMELALAFAMEIEGIDGITFLSAGTDGTDGPTDATGAVVDGQTIRKAKAAGLDPSAYLSNNDSYRFFKNIDGLIITGPTGTNVMDIQVIILEKS